MERGGVQGCCRADDACCAQDAQGQKPQRAEGSEARITPFSNYQKNHVRQRPPEPKTRTRARQAEWSKGALPAQTCRSERFEKVQGGSKHSKEVQGSTAPCESAAPAAKSSAAPATKSAPDLAKGLRLPKRVPEKFLPQGPRQFRRGFRKVLYGFEGIESVPESRKFQRAPKKRCGHGQGRRILFRGLMCSKQAGSHF